MCVVDREELPFALAGEDLPEQFELFSAAEFNSWAERPVELPPGRARLATKPRTNRIDRAGEYDRDGAADLLQRSTRGVDGRAQHPGERDQFSRLFPKGHQLCPQRMSVHS